MSTVILAQSHFLVFKMALAGQIAAASKSVALAHVGIAKLLVEEHAPDVTAEWLAKNLTEAQADIIENEVARQMIALEAARGLAGRA